MRIAGLCVVLYVIFGLSVAASAGPPINVRAHGATGDGATLDTKAIQAAIDACAEAGGGMVVFPAGRYLSGTIRLRSQVHLYLDTNAVLLGSTRVEDFPLIAAGVPSRTDNYTARSLIWGEGLTDVAITGRGTIDGQGAAYLGHRAGPEDLAAAAALYEGTGRYLPNEVYLNRPYVLRLVQCRDVRIEGITMRNAPMWMQHYLDCDFVTIRGITVYNHGNRNNDMIDIDSCRNVIIADCFGDTDDDALTLKSTTGRPTEHVVITNCVLRSRCNAIKAGTESSGGFRDIAISNCVIQRSSMPEGHTGRAEGLAGVALEIVDGGTLERVSISNLVIEGTTAPIFMRLGNRARPPKADMPPPPVGVFRDVSISDVTATGASVTGCAIAGIPGHPIENVRLSNIRIEFAGGGPADASTSEVPENEAKYPESTMFGILPAYGFYVRHVDGLDLDNVALRHAKPDPRPALVCDDVGRLRIRAFEAMAAPEAPAQMVFRNTHDAVIMNSVAAPGAAFLWLDEASTGPTLIGNDLHRAKSPSIVTESGLDASPTYRALNQLPEH